MDKQLIRNLILALCLCVPAFGQGILAPILQGSPAAGTPITFGNFAIGHNGSATTSVASAALNLPSGQLAFAVCFAGGTSVGTTFSMADTATNSWPSNTLLFHSTSGSFQIFYSANTIANASDVATCTISPSIGGNYAAVIFGNVSGLATSTPTDVTTAGNNQDAGSSGTTFTSASFTTTQAKEFVLSCTLTSNFGTFTVGTIGGVGATLQTSEAANQGNDACQYIITSSTISSGTSSMTASGAVRWAVTVASFHQ